MRLFISNQLLRAHSVLLALVAASACGESESTPGNPAGDWLTVSLENMTQEVRVECPGASGELECGTATLSLAESGTLTVVETTDETGAPSDYRYEGIWRTEGDRLTLVLSAEGTDAESLQPIDPPDELTGTYMLSGDTLTLSDVDEDGDTVLTTYERI